MDTVGVAVEIHRSLDFGVDEGLVNVLVALGMQYGVAHLVGQSSRREGQEEEDARTRFRWGSNRALRGTWR